LVFYNAMIIFAHKHFSKKYASLYSFFINLAIYIRASLAVIKRIFYFIFFPLTDALIIYSGFVFIRPYWEYYKFSGSGSYPDIFLFLVVPIYTVIWIASIILSGGYLKPFRMIRVRRGIIFGTFMILLIYALLPENLRFSRALILLGTTWTLIFTHLIRILFNLFKSKPIHTEFQKIKKRIVIVGEKEEANRVYSIIKYSYIIPDLIGIVSPEQSPDNAYIGNISQLSNIIRINNIEEIVFCGKNISSQEIIKNMLIFSDNNVEFKIAPQESSSVIGSSSINTSGDLYTISFNSVTKPANRRKKRIFDIFISLILLISSPLLVFMVKSQKRLFKNLARVLTGKLTFVGYVLEGDGERSNLTIQGIFYPHHQIKRDFLSHEANLRLNIEYAQNYLVQNDFNIILSNLFSIDRRPD